MSESNGNGTVTEITSEERELDRAVSSLAIQDKTSAYVLAGGLLVNHVNRSILQSRATKVGSKDIQRDADAIFEASLKRIGQSSAKARGVDLVRVFFLAEMAKEAGFGVSSTWTTAQMTARNTVITSYVNTGRGTAHIDGAWKDGGKGTAITMARNAEGKTRDALNLELKAQREERVLEEQFAGNKSLMDQMKEIKEKASAVKTLKDSVRKACSALGTDEAFAIATTEFERIADAEAAADKAQREAYLADQKEASAKEASAKEANGKSETMVVESLEPVTV